MKINIFTVFRYLYSADVLLGNCILANILTCYLKITKRTVIRNDFFKSELLELYVFCWQEFMRHTTTYAFAHIKILSVYNQKEVSIK